MRVGYDSLDKVIFFEIPVDNSERAREFYSSTFGRKVNEIPNMHYTQVGTVEADRMGLRGISKEVGPIDGGIVERRRELVETPVIYVNVNDDIHKAAAAIESTVGKSLNQEHRLETLDSRSTSRTQKVT